MRGHDAIVSMRRAGKRPAFVFINDWPCRTDWAQNGAHATVCTAGDDIALLDLRFLVGLQVSVCASTEERAKALFEACKAAGVRMVAAGHVKDGGPAVEQDGWAALWLAEEVAHG